MTRENAIIATFGVDKVSISNYYYRCVAERNTKNKEKGGE